MNDKDCPKMKINEQHIKIHEHFNDDTFENDIAIIHLPDAVNLNGFYIIIKIYDKFVYMCNNRL